MSDANGPAPAPARASSDKPSPNLARKALSGLFELVVIIVGALIISALLRAFVGQMFEIPSGSMEHTLDIGDRVVVSKITDFERGDVVVFTDSQQWLPEGLDRRVGFGRALEFIGVLPSTSSNHLIKRVIGLPGDTVECCDASGRLSVNGHPLDESSYLFTDNGVQVQPAAVEFKVVVPAERIFVMGDHRNASSDSRCHLADILNDGRPRGAAAFVPIDDVVGPAVAIAAPLDRLSLIRDPQVYEAVPDATQPAPDQAVIEPEGVGCS